MLNLNGLFLNARRSAGCISGILYSEINFLRRFKLLVYKIIDMLRRESAPFGIGVTNDPVAISSLPLGEGRREMIACRSPFRRTWARSRHVRSPSHQCHEVPCKS